MLFRLNGWFPTVICAMLAVTYAAGSAFAADAGTISFASATYTVSQSADSVTLTVNRTGGATGAIDVYWDTLSGTALGGRDFWLAAGHLDWIDGDASPRTIKLTTGETAPFSGIRSFTVPMSVTSGGAVMGAVSSASVNISGSLGAGSGTLELAAPTYTVAQSAASISVSVNRAGGSSGLAKVFIATQGGTAVAGTDFVNSSAWLMWPDGDATAKTFSVQLKSVAAYSGTKDFDVVIEYPYGAPLGSPTKAAVAINGTAGTPAPSIDVTVSVMPSSSHAISPYIYGVNAGTIAPLAVPYASVTLNRMGGNRWTAYNWQNNYSNAGSDYLYESDSFLSSSTTPLAAITPSIDTDRINKVASLITVPMLGYVSADNTGPVPLTNPIDVSRFKTLVYAKGSAFTAKPSNSDASVYDDEMVWALDQHYSGEGIFSSTPSVPPVMIELDNEPDLWNSTHQEIETSTEISPSALFTKTVNLSAALKQQFPQAIVMGPVNFGYSGFYNWQGAWSGASNSGYNWFLDGYLQAVDAAAKSRGSTLVDAYSLHWYSEATDSSGTRVVNLSSSSLSADSVQAIVQSPRSLWDPGYVERSWISQDTGIGAIKLIPRVLDKIAHAGSDNSYAIAKMAITEYFNGGNNHIAGTLAEADNLGIFGAQGLYAASLWPLASAPYPLGAFASFRNFDGAGHNFGDISIAASSSNVANVSGYVSTDSTRPGRVVMVLINRSTTAQTTAVTGQPLTGTAHLFRTTAASASAQGNVIAPQAAGTLAVSGSTLTVALPALSVTTIDIY